jgi:RNA 3'-terminal phosphate cyclase (ATP)
VSTSARGAGKRGAKAGGAPHAKAPPVLVDGAKGEGGGQTLRTALSLSLVTGRPFVIDDVRGGREDPGLAQHHVVTIEAAAAVGGARVEGATVGSSRVSFEPTKLTPGNYAFSIGSAGSATLLLQTLVPALLTASGPSLVEVEGGTHVPFAPTFDFLAATYAPILSRMGPTVDVGIERRGFVPKGGGRIFARVEPAPIQRFDMTKPVEVTGRRARSIIEQLRRDIAERELAVVGRRLGLMSGELVIEQISTAPSPGNYLVVELESRDITEVISSIGERGVRSEEVAARAAEEARRYLDRAAPIGEYLADQLLLPLALGPGGAFLSGPPTPHTITNADLIEQFLDVEISFVDADDGCALITVKKKGEAGPPESF